MFMEMEEIICTIVFIRNFTFLKCWLHKMQESKNNKTDTIDLDWRHAEKKWPEKWWNKTKNWEGGEKKVIVIEKGMKEKICLN